MVVLCFFYLLPSIAVAKVPEVMTFPAKVYLEVVPNGRALNFEYCFKVEEDCSLFLVTFKYLDDDEEPLRYRRLVIHQLPDLSRFVTVFSSKNQMRTCTNKLSRGDLCAITHPYSEQAWSFAKPAFVECTAYLKAKEDNSIATKTLKVPIEKREGATKISLPFRGTWWHLEGHDTFSHHRRIYYKENTNYFAFDFIKVDDNLAVCTGSGRKNEDYYAFGEAVLAVAPGKVVEVIDGRADNPIGSRAKGFEHANPKYVGGNTVVIEHGPKLFSYYGHFKKNSIRVKKGEPVEAGQLLGDCGNSGNSDAPHIHFHLAESPSLSALGAHAVPAVFAEFQIKAGSKWQTLTNCGLLAGEIVKPHP